MTIIQPHKNDYKANFLISMLVLASMVASVWGIFFYNQLVSFRHEIKQAEASIQNAEVTNAELKNNLYGAIDQSNLESLINSQSLILDKNPEYVKNNPLAASR